MPHGTNLLLTNEIDAVALSTPVLVPDVFDVSTTS